jgi:hypothetical protein
MRQVALFSCAAAQPAPVPRPVSSRVSKALVAAVTSRWRIRLSPTRKVEMPSFASCARSADVDIPLSPDNQTIARHLRSQHFADVEARFKGSQASVVDADHR